MEKAKRDMISMIVIMGISFLFCVWFIPAEIRVTDHGTSAFTSRSFPYLLMSAMLVISFYRRYVKRLSGSRLLGISNTILYAAGICAVILVAYGAFTGSPAINPDESEGIYSVRYYTTHWKIPDMRELPLEAYSLYGTARLSELNLYYMLAALIARFVTLESGTRFFGVCMMAGLFYLAFWNLKKNR